MDQKETKPTLFEHASCSSFLISVENENGVSVFTSDQNGNYIQKTPTFLIPFGAKLMSLGYDKDKEFYNTMHGWVKKSDIIVQSGANFNNTLEALKYLAMPEEWTYSKITNRPLPILYNYILHTFARASEQKKIVAKDNYSCFNTGLVTANQEDIFFLFRHKADSNVILSEICKESSKQLSKFDTLPESYKMKQDDYFLKQIDLLGRVLGKILAELLKLKSKVEVIEMSAFTSQTLKSELDIDLDELVSMTDIAMIQFLQNEKNFNHNHLEKIAEILYLIDFDSDNTKDLILKKSLVILEFLDRTSTTYSLERISKIELIKLKLV
jgi:hypothetical protein